MYLCMFMDRCVLLPKRVVGSGGHNPNLLLEFCFLSYYTFRNYMIRNLFSFVHIHVVSRSSA